MKTYQLTQDEFGKYLVSTDESGKETGIPFDPANSDYAEYLRYTEWVESGKNPDEFWTQTLEL
jgi:hypothetical protein